MKWECIGSFKETTITICTNCSADIGFNVYICTFLYCVVVYTFKNLIRVLECTLFFQKKGVSLYYLMQLVLLVKEYKLPWFEVFTPILQQKKTHCIVMQYDLTSISIKYDTGVGTTKRKKIKQHRKSLKNRSFSCSCFNTESSSILK